jgi:hypothetical protein
MPKSRDAFRSRRERRSGLGITQHMKKQCCSVISRVVCPVAKKDPGALESARGTTQCLDHDRPPIRRGSTDRRPVG